MKFSSALRAYTFLFLASRAGHLAEAATPVIVAVGTPTTVFAHADRCEEMDLPDEPLRAFRRADNLIVAFSTHYVNRRLIGTSLSNLTHDCRLVYQGGHLADPAMFDDRTWIAATWTDDGVHVDALGHNEYQAEHFPGRCVFKTYNQCWYNAIVPLYSNDQGSTFSRKEYPKPIAAASTENEIEQGRPRGYFSPSNIIRWNEYFYVLIARSALENQRAGRCLFRTKDISLPDAWTAWDGVRFSQISGSPYERDWKAPVVCVPITGIDGFLGSISLVGGTKTFAAFSIAESKDSADGGYINVAFSSDLLHWHDTQHVMAVTPAWSRKCPRGVRYSYPAVLSYSERDRNFQSLESRAFLFLVRSSCVDPLNRNLERFELSVRQ